MSKRRIIFILLLALTLIYPLVFYYSVQAYEQECAAALERYPEELRPYVDYGPFTGSLSGFIAILFGASIAVSWFILFLWRK